MVIVIKDTYGCQEHGWAVKPVKFPNYIEPLRTLFMTLITIHTATHNMHVAHVCSLCVRVPGHFSSVRFHFILLQCCWWDWCLLSNGPLITDLMALEHGCDFTGWQVTLNMNQGDFQCEAHEGCNTLFIYAKPQFKAAQLNQYGYVGSMNRTFINIYDTVCLTSASAIE